jgi:hypothetical protein
MRWLNRWSDSSLPKPNTSRKDSYAYTQQLANFFHFRKLKEATTPCRLVSAMSDALLASALFRCWHIMLFYLGWATMVVLINEKVMSLEFQPTLLTV